MHVRTANDIWTDLRWWQQISLLDTRVVLANEDEDEELLVVDLLSEGDARELFRVMNERIRHSALRFEVARWLADHPSAVVGAST